MRISVDYFLKSGPTRPVQLRRANRQFPKVEKKGYKFSLFKILHEKFKLQCFLFFSFFSFLKQKNWNVRKKLAFFICALYSMTGAMSILFLKMKNWSIIKIENYKDCLFVRINGMSLLCEISVIRISLYLAQNLD